jgi:radical SAM protein with 4Fe4S-binding SPASM domain
MGEPLLHPEFPELMGICGMLGFQVNIATNGVLIGRYREALMNSGALRQINFSIHCMDIQKNSKLPDDYLPEILDFIAAGSKKSKAYFALRLWNLKPGNEMNSTLLKQIGEFFNLHFKLEDRIIKEKGISLAPNVFLNIAEEFSWPEISSIQEKSPMKHPGEMPVLHLDDKGFCRGLRDHCAILVDGTVVPCCLDKDGAIFLGNIFESEFENIINSKKAQNIINGFSEGKAIEPLCKTCEFRKRFSK